jgi:hypothetical protein
VSTRWFFSSARHGVAAGVSAGPALATQVTFNRQMGGGASDITAPGPDLRLAGPGHVAGIERGLIMREEPPPGTTSAAQNILASVELAYADLPWLLSVRERPGAAAGQPFPWIVLVVLSTDEAAPPRDANPLPILTAPHAALPPLDESWAWAHVEARLEDKVQDVGTAEKIATDHVRTRSAAVVARLVCPRRLESHKPHETWIAAVVPATAAGVSAGLGNAAVAAPADKAWPPADGRATVDLPVYHWWTFRTGEAGSFEDLARRVKFKKAAALGLGSRIVDVSHPWPAGQTAGPATVALDGALRVTGLPDTEKWSDETLQHNFRRDLRDQLNAPAARRQHTDGPNTDRDDTAVGPPLYGSHHSGAQTVEADDDAGWITTLNLEVRRRVAAALGARYVQLEQEFLMARAWEQAGAIREANRILAAAELAAVTAEVSHRKHFQPLDPADLVTTMAPLAGRVVLPPGFGRTDGPGLVAPNESATLSDVLADSRVPDGMATTAFSRLARTSGALRRRVDRLTDGGANDASTIGAELPRRQDGMGLAPGEPALELPDELRARTAPIPLQLRRIAGLIATPDIAGRTPQEPRPLRPIMAHPQFHVAVAEEILARWPDWAIPGIEGLPPDSVTILETNPGFVAALLVGLNQEFNRELLWREFPTDQRGTPFARFWPTPGADVDEIARWPVDTALGSQIREGTEGSLVLLMRGEVLRRFPGAALLAVRGENGRVPETFAGIAAIPLPLDESTVLFLFSGFDEDTARAQDWFFVLREPMRGTQFGFDLGAQGPMKSWADLTWDAVPVHANRCVRADTAPTVSPPPGTPDQPVWGRDAADMARIAFQQPFQLAFRAATLLGP